MNTNTVEIIFPKIIRVWPEKFIATRMVNEYTVWCDWCDQHVNPNSWSVSVIPCNHYEYTQGLRFMFNNSSDAVEFKLRWL